MSKCRFSAAGGLIGSLAAMLLASAAFCASSFAQQLTAPPLTNFTFPMVATLGVESCVPAKGRVTITHTPILEENMHVEVSGLPANTDFDLFVIQQPTPNFGDAWYMGDMLTDRKSVV